MKRQSFLWLVSLQNVQSIFTFVYVSNSFSVITSETDFDHWSLGWAVHDQTGTILIIPTTARNFVDLSKKFSLQLFCTTKV